MQLKLTVTSAHAPSLGADAVSWFRLRGGTIGRTRDNDWVLPDPERIVSSHHARILYDRGAYYIEDTSSNGTCLNQSDAPLPPGQPVELSHGDTLFIGQYEIHVELAEEMPRPIPADSRAADFVAKPYIPEPSSLQRELPPGNGPRPFAEKPDLRDAPDHSPAGNQWHDLGEFGAESDHLAADRQSFRPPAATPELIPEDIPPPVSETLPDDWWKADDETPAEPVLSEPPQAPTRPNVTPAAPPPPKRPMPEAPLPREGYLKAPQAEEPVVSVPPAAKPGAPQTPAAPVSVAPIDRGSPDGSASADIDILLAAFFEGLGLGPGARAGAETEVLFRQCGRLLRLLTQRTIEILQARSTLKGEFRLSQTIVRPAENNPLKFSLGADQALRQFFVDRRPGFLGPEAAFTEALNDIKQHEIAVIAGMRAAFDCLLQKFAPETIEAQLRASTKPGPRLPFGNKPWAFYQAYYADFKANAGDDFQGIFGQDFVRAYEDQINRLSSPERTG
ncbi:MAG: domain containing protein [Proteobacteria bacterium]|nr:domain containing protein [Pseudomonadota bacterium]